MLVPPSLRCKHFCCQCVCPHTHLRRLSRDALTYSSLRHSCVDCEDTIDGDTIDGNTTYSDNKNDCRLLLCTTKFDFPRQAICKISIFDFLIITMPYRKRIQQ